MRGLNRGHPRDQLFIGDDPTHAPAGKGQALGCRADPDQDRLGVHGGGVGDIVAETEGRVGLIQDQADSPVAAGVDELRQLSVVDGRP